MLCGDEMATRLSRYVDGELPTEERALVEDHLTRCQACRELKTLFERNERLLAGALSTESFGNAVIESVMRSLHGEENPPEARPVEATLWERLRERRWLPVAAAALLAAAAGLALLRRYPDGAELRELAAQAREELKEARRAVAEQREENERILYDLAVLRARRDDVEFTSLGYMGPNHYLVVRATFEPDAYQGYDVIRRDEDQDDTAYTRLNPERLQEPVFTDTTARGGKGYVYKFRAWREDGGYDESAPLLMRTLVIPEGSLKIHCTKIAAPKDLAVFEIEKMVQGRPHREEFIVRLNELLGGVRNVPGAGPVDFSTGYILDRIEEGLQWLEVTYTVPRTDDRGRPIIERLGRNSVVPATTVRHEWPIAVRENRRAILRPAPGISTDRGEVRIWQGARVWARVR